jgi:4-hydroxy-4-methyl-2-oxoglutarate aldolase
MIDASEWAEYESKLAGVVPKNRFAKINFPRPSAELISQLKNIEDPTPTLSDILDDMGIAGTVPATILKAVCPGKVVVGPALTLRYVPETKVPKQSMLDSAKGKLGDKDAYAVAKPGDVVIFDNGGRETISTFATPLTRE